MGESGTKKAPTMVKLILMVAFTQNLTPIIRKFTLLRFLAQILGTNEIEVHFQCLTPVIIKFRFMETVTPIFHSSNYAIHIVVFNINAR